MMSAPAILDDFESLRFSSADLRPDDRIPFYRDLMDRMFMRMDFESLDERFACEAHGYRFPDLSIYCVTGSAVRGGWKGAMVEGSHDLTLAMCLEGTTTISQQGREVSISVGSAILHSIADPMRMERTAGRFAVVGMPRTVLAPMLADPDKALMSVIPSTIEPLRLLIGYVDLLIKDPTLLETADMRRLVVNHVHDLVAVSVGVIRDAAEVAAGRGLRARRLQAIKADIAQRHARNVTAAALSSRHGLSPRYIRKLFESENTTLSQYVLGQRLMHAHRMLADPRCAHRTIGELALAAGFGDISTFNRDFRRRFGMTPSDVRRRSGIM
jgi:AraC-like DNA-binding protein